MKKRGTIKSRTSMQSHAHRTWIEIDTDALTQNAEGIRSLLEPRTQLMAIVKANAYGHGIDIAVPALAAVADWFGVDSPEEALAVRGLTGKPVLIVNPMHPDDAPDVVSGGFHQMVSTSEQLEALARAAQQQGTRAHVHIKIDTGMSRQGFLPDAAVATVLPMLAARESLHLAGVATHFATADDPDNPAMADQLARFAKFLADANVSGALVHAANSAAAMLDPETHFDLVRAGIALYGISPAPGVGGGYDPVPVLAMKSRVMQVKTVPAGEGVGYGLTSRADHKRRIALPTDTTAVFGIMRMCSSAAAGPRLPALFLWTSQRWTSRIFRMLRRAILRF